MFKGASATGCLFAVVKVLLFCSLFTGLFVLLSSLKSLVPGAYERFAHGAVGTVAALAVTLAFLRAERRSFADIGLRAERRTLLRFFQGLALGVGIATSLFALLIAFGNMRLVPHAATNLPQFLFWTLALLPLAFVEEVAFRAYPLSTLMRSMPPRFALVIAAVLFALYHVANGWPLFISFAGPGVWGLIFGLAAIRSKGVAMATGIHYACNLVQSAIGMGRGFVPL